MILSALIQGVNENTTALSALHEQTTTPASPTAQGKPYYVDEAACLAFWREWRETGSQAAYEAVFGELRGLVEFNARLAASAGSWSYDDAISEAWLIAVEAVAQYDEGRGGIGGLVYTRLGFRLRPQLAHQAEIAASLAAFPIGLASRYQAALRKAYGDAGYAESMLRAGEQLGLSLDTFRAADRVLSSQREEQCPHHEHRIRGEVGVDDTDDDAARALAPLLSALTADERTVVTHRFGLDGVPPQSTIELLRAELGWTRARTQQTLSRALQRLCATALGEGSSAVEAQTRALQALAAA